MARLRSRDFVRHNSRIMAKYFLPPPENMGKTQEIGRRAVGASVRIYGGVLLPRDQSRPTRISNRQ